MKTQSAALLLFLAGCAGQPPADPRPAVAAPSAAASGGANPVKAVARVPGYQMVTRDGVVFYCRSDIKTGSRLVQDETCLTAEQLRQMDERTRRNMQNISNALTAPMAPQSH